MKCTRCGKENRDIARYCKWCGAAAGSRPSAAAHVGQPSADAAGDSGSGSCSPLDSLVDKEAIKTLLRDIVAKAEAMKAYNDAHGLKFRMELSFVITGDSGTGKATVAATIAALLHEKGLVNNPVPKTVDPTDYQKFMDKIDENLKNFGNGVLVIKEADKHVPDGKQKDVAPIDHIIKHIRRWRGDAARPVVILLGGARLRKFFDENPVPKSAVNYFLETPAISDDGLLDITERLLRDNYGRTLSEEGRQKLRRIYLNDRRNPEAAKGAGGHNAARRAYDITLRCMGVIAEGTPVGPDLIDGTEYIPKTFDEVLRSFDRYVGVEEIKEVLRGIALQLDEQRGQKGPGATVELYDHFQFLGNPGTGKTTMARLFADALNALGALPVGHLVEVGRDELVSQYVGETPKLVRNVFDRAMGGVLFIDEAYNLIPADATGARDQAGNEAIDALMTRMSNDAGKFVTVFAGYKMEMDEFIANANPGLKRRFTHSIHIDDYSVDELVEIFMLNARKEGYRLTPEAGRLLNLKVEEMVSAKDKRFGNAGEMVKLFNETKDRQSDRIATDLSDDLSDETLYTIEKDDIPYDAPKKIDIAECMRELDALQGLQAVKEAVRELADTLVVERKRNADAGGRHTLNLDHFLFLGNPGTGKTTVARIMGNIFYSLGLLPSNKVIEVTPKDLIAPYVGQTAPKTEQVVNRAIGGILFLDEAYGLNDGANGFGKDAMPVLLTKLLDLKGRFVCIAAGYHREMQQWIDTNTGLESRFTRRINFEDYSAAELSDIFRSIVRKAGMKMDEGAETEMERYFNILVYNKGRNFANAREARNYFDRVKLNQGRRLRRLIQNPDFDNGELYMLRRDDMMTNDNG